MTLYKEKFAYTPFSRENVEGKRLYATPDGSRVPSVTTILDKTKPIEKRIALANWKKRVGEVKAQEIVTEAAGRGTRMHKFLEDYVKTGVFNPPGTNPYSKQSHAMAELVIAEGLTKVTEIWGVEVPLYYPGIYAGTTDGCGLHMNEEAIIDYKQTNKPKKREWIDDYFIQECAYAQAHNQIHGTNIRKGVILMCVSPRLDENLVMIEKPTYQEFIVEGAEFDKYVNIWWDRVEQFYRTEL
jgi:genome maintenance exonuclease 1